MTDFLDDREFYELSQAYRHAVLPKETVDAWEALKSHIRVKTSPRNYPHLFEGLVLDFDESPEDESL